MIRRLFLAALLAFAPALARAQAPNGGTPTFDSLAVVGSASAASVTTPSLVLGGFTLTGVGTTAGTLAAGNDSRIVGALQATAAAATYAPINSPNLTGAPTAPTPSAGDNSTRIATTASVNAAIAAGGGVTTPLGQARLSYGSATAVLLKPYNGNQITIAGVNRTIPSSGITLANTGLSANTLYYVYALWNGSSIALGAVTTGHATDATTGVEVLSVDATRTLVGMVYTGSGTPGTFVDSLTSRTVASYFNRQDRALQAASATYTTSSTTLAEITTAQRLAFLTWPDEIPDLQIAGSMYNNTAGNSVQLALGIDGAQFGNFLTATESTAAYPFPAFFAQKPGLSEGYHTASPFGSVGGYGGSYSIQTSGRVRN